MNQHKDRYSSVWVLTQQHNILKVGSNGDTQSISPSNFAVHICFSIDGTLWMVPQSKQAFNNHISYSEDEGQNWIQVDIPNLKISIISSTPSGSCFILTAQGSIYLVQKSGEIDLIFDEGTAHDIAVSPEGFIWIISRQTKPGGGNLVYWCSLDNYVLQPAHGQPVAKRISAGPEGTARIITIGGEVASIYLTRMGGLETTGGEVFAKNIAASCSSNTIWAICREDGKKKKKHILKFWNPDLDQYMKWHTIANVEPFAIAGGN